MLSKTVLTTWLDWTQEKTEQSNSLKKIGYPLNKVAPKDFVSFTKPRQFQKKTSKTHQKWYVFPRKKHHKKIRINEKKLQGKKNKMESGTETGSKRHARKNGKPWNNIEIIESAHVSRSNHAPHRCQEFVCFFFNRRASLRNMGMGCPEGKKNRKHVRS